LANTKKQIPPNNKQKRRSKTGVRGKISELAKIIAAEKFACKYDKQVAREALVKFVVENPKTTSDYMRKAHIAAIQFYPDKCPCCGQEIKVK